MMSPELSPFLELPDDRGVSENVESELAARLIYVAPRAVAIERMVVADD
jgi:hypothetical protein